MMLDNRPMTRSKLSELALDAAIELETTPDESPHPTLKEFLKEVAAQISDVNGVSSLKDETLFPVYSFALRNSVIDAPHTRRDLISLLRDTLNVHIGADSIDDKEKLRGFCLAVHEALITDLLERRIATVKRDDRIRIH